MSETNTAVTTPQPTNPMKAFFMQPNVQKTIDEVMKDGTKEFVLTILQIANGNDMLKNADPITLLNAALTAAALKLPINPNLGFAYLVPYKNNKTNKIEAQFQIGWKGIVQLAQRTNQYATINTAVVRENQLKRVDHLTGEVEFNEVEPEGKIIGFIAYFRLKEGFQKVLYMSIENMTKHAKKYSQSFKKGYGVWADGEDGFNAMGMKTVLKLLVNRFGPLSVDVQKATLLDQAVQRQQPGEAEEIEYVDNTDQLSLTEKAEINKAHEQIEALITNATTTAAMNKFVGDVPEELKDMFWEKHDKLKAEGK